MWVDPAHLGAGLGAHLLRHATDVVRSLGGTSLAIASDPNAEGFYRRMGARRVGSVPSTPTGRELPLLVIEIDSTS
jgi:GNAT superfamily N-acetyltransferase